MSARHHLRCRRGKGGRQPSMLPLRTRAAALAAIASLVLAAPAMAASPTAGSAGTVARDSRPSC
ncbi:hypothetical protein Sru01_01470 [Sphaerisporangium rufum]|uniref:Uncharacterized protein n=1 Tax=Sphaerisporangium rufum TaxID=1381558 RepID=A0A919V2C6_9ACTN|nr:hypothetical protein Sru01_01470 [Sphaerisporangium rufum]